MILLLIRHAEAEANAPRDEDRRLTTAGQRQACRLGKFLRKQKFAPARLWSSPYARALETAKHIAEELSPEPALETLDELGCGMRPESLLALAKREGNEDCVVVVGHQPDLGLAAAALLGSAREEPVEVRKGACLCFDLQRPAVGGATLLWLVTPKLLA